MHYVLLVVNYFVTAGGDCDRFILCEEMDELYQSLDDADADDSLVTEAAELQQRRQDWLSQMDFNKCALYQNLYY